MAALADEVSQSVAAIIEATGEPVRTCPGEWRVMALEHYGGTLAEIGRMFAEAGKKALDAANNINAVAIDMMQRAATGTHAGETWQ